MKKKYTTDERLLELIAAFMVGMNEIYKDKDKPYERIWYDLYGVIDHTDYIELIEVYTSKMQKDVTANKAKEDAERKYQMTMKVKNLLDDLTEDEYVILKELIEE